MSAQSCRLKLISGLRFTRRSQAKAFSTVAQILLPFSFYKDSMELEQLSGNLNQNKLWSRYPVNTAEDLKLFYWI